MRGRPAIVGTVRDAVTGRPLSGARVEITGAARFEHGSRLERCRTALGGATEERSDRVRTAADGQFLFIDLPARRYRLVATLPDAGTRYGAAHENARVPGEATSDVPSVELALPPTTLAGTVKGPGSIPVALARVTVEGSGESTLTGDPARSRSSASRRVPVACEPRGGASRRPSDV